jgi:trimeric autotransporter adhesin
VYVTDLPLASQPDSTLESFKRYRAGFDVAALKIRFYQCNVRKSDQAAQNCETAGDGSLAISTQGGVRLMRVASGYPAELISAMQEQRFWAQMSGNVFRGMTDLEHTRYDQRLNGPAWAALRAALNIPEHAEPVAPVQAGPFRTLRNFSFTDAANYSLRTFEGDSSQLDANGRYVANERRITVAAGVVQPFVRNRSYWTGSEWYECPNDGQGVNVVDTLPPLRSYYCRAIVEDIVGSTTLTIGGRLMSEIVNDIRSYGSMDGGVFPNSWGPTPAQHPQLASTRFPDGATMSYRGLQQLDPPLTIATAPADQVRVAPSPTSGEPFNNWPFAANLEEGITRYPGNLVGGTLNGNTALFVWRFTEQQPAGSPYTNEVQIRVSFNANGNQARFYRNNRALTTGFTTNYQTLLDTTYTIETVGGVRLLRFAAMPAGFEDSYRFTRLFAERNGAVWYAFQDVPPTQPNWSVRLNKTALEALMQALGAPLN